jgi:hypothetical protein
LAEPLSDLTGSDIFFICRLKERDTRASGEFRDWIGCDVDALGFQGNYSSSWWLGSDVPSVDTSEPFASLSL